MLDLVIQKSQNQETGVTPARVSLSWAYQRENKSGGYVSAMATRVGLDRGEPESGH